MKTPNNYVSLIQLIRDSFALLEKLKKYPQILSYFGSLSDVNIDYYGLWTLHTVQCVAY